MLAPRCNWLTFTLSFLVNIDIDIAPTTHIMSWSLTFPDLFNCEKINTRKPNITCKFLSLWIHCMFLCLFFIYYIYIYIYIWVLLYPGNFLIAHSHFLLWHASRDSQVLSHFQIYDGTFEESRIGKEEKLVSQL